MRRRAIARRSDQDWWRARLSGKSRKPGDCAEERGRRDGFGQTRRIDHPRCIGRQYPGCGMHRRATRAIVVLAWRRGAVIVGTGVGEIRRAADAGLFCVESRERKPGARGGSDKDNGMRSNCGRMRVLRGHQQLREACKQDKATTDSARQCSRGVSRENPMIVWLETARSHVLRLWTDGNDSVIESVSVPCSESSNNP